VEDFLKIVLTALLVAVLAWITVTDFRSRRIPDLASLPLIALGLLLSGGVSGLGLADRLMGAGLGFLILWAVGEAFWRLRGVEGLGIGDAKLFGAAGAWLGWQALPVVLLIAAVMGLAFAALTGRRELAFGPWLAAGFALCWGQILLV
jgi:leader peptidase (prepilin peptidase)/N-methyltransferase